MVLCFAGDIISFTMPRLRRIFWVTVFAIILGAGWLVYNAVSVSLKAEHAHHAGRLTLTLLAEYVESRQGQWPSGWSDLEQLPPREHAGFHWPADSAEVQSYVSVDFKADPRELAKIPEKLFEIALPIGPYFEYRDVGGKQLQKSLQKYWR